jgi:hypothetical protein
VQNGRTICGGAVKLAQNVFKLGDEELENAFLDKGARAGLCRGARNLCQFLCFSLFLP